MDTSIARGNIVAAVDGSPASVAALRYAERIAFAFDRRIEVVTTWNRPSVADAADVAGWFPQEWAQDVLDRSIAEAFPSGAPDGLIKKVRVGPPARSLIELSEHAGMLVVGSRGRGGFTGLLLGSVSAACAAHAHCPVLIVHADGSVVNGRP